LSRSLIGLMGNTEDVDTGHTRSKDSPATMRATRSSFRAQDWIAVIYNLISLSAVYTHRVKSCWTRSCRRATEGDRFSMANLTMSSGEV
jgi:hypothetical protein